MPNRTTSHETDKLDHSTPPLSHSTKDDLKAPGGGRSEVKMDKKRDESSKKPNGANATR